MVKSKGRVSANFHYFKFERKVEIRISGLRYFFLRREVQKMSQIVIIIVIAILVRLFPTQLHNHIKYILYVYVSDKM